MISGQRIFYVAEFTMGGTEVLENNASKHRIATRRQFIQNGFEFTDRFSTVSRLDRQPREILPNLGLLAPFADAGEARCGFVPVLSRLGKLSLVSINETDVVLDVGDAIGIVELFE